MTPRILSLVVLTLIGVAPAAAQRNWNAPFPAHQVIDNIYFVGTEQLGSFLVTTSEGHILINSDFESTVPSIRASVEALGFDFADIEIILGSHAHGDHMEADALVKELTGSFGVNPGYILVDNPAYPGIADDYRATYARARALPVDVFLGSHGFWYDMARKLERAMSRVEGEPNPFIDRAGYLAHIDMQEQRFEEMLKEQQEAKR